MKIMTPSRPASLVLATLFLAGSVGAVGPMGGGMGPRAGQKGPRSEARHQRLQQELKLTAEQEKKLEAHRQAHRPQAEALRQELKQKREALHAELAKPELDKARVEAIHGELKAVQDRLADHRLQGMLEVRGILTPEQFKKFQSKGGPWKGSGPAEGH